MGLTNRRFVKGLLLQIFVLVLEGSFALNFLSKFFLSFASLRSSDAKQSNFTEGKKESGQKSRFVKSKLSLRES